MGFLEFRIRKPGTARGDGVSGRGGRPSLTHRHGFLVIYEIVLPGAAADEVRVHAPSGIRPIPTVTLRLKNRNLGLIPTLIEA
jgi:hypothetical protein